MITVDFIAFIWGVHAATKPAHEPHKCSCTCHHTPVAVRKATPEDSSDGFKLAAIAIAVILALPILLILIAFISKYN